MSRLQDMLAPEDEVMRYLQLFLIVLTIAALQSGCGNSVIGEPLRGDSNGMNLPLSKSVPDMRPAMTFDVEKPYCLQFGRGSGLDGMDTIALDESGRVLLCRKKHAREGDGFNTYWETKSFQTGANEIRQIASLIQDLDIIGMDREYYADIQDGTQWVFWLIQGDQEKTVYFSNHFPEVIQDFAMALDELLEDGTWARIPDEQGWSHADALWNAIKSNSNRND